MNKNSDPVQSLERTDHLIQDWQCTVVWLFYWNNDSVAGDSDQDITYMYLYK